MKDHPPDQRLAHSVRQKLANHPYPVVILLCGMPASGKSSTAVRLASQLGLVVCIGTDEIRDVMQLYDDRPILAGKSHNRWRLFGAYNRHNFLKGYLGHCRALQKGVAAIINKNLKIGESLIVEGVHLTPSLYPAPVQATKFHFLLLAKDPDYHRKLVNGKLIRQRYRRSWTNSTIKHMNGIERYLLAEAKQHTDLVCLYTTNVQQNVQVIMKHLFTSL